MNKTIALDGIQQTVHLMGITDVRHPLVELVDFRQISNPVEMAETRFLLGYYLILFKETKCSDIIYGRNKYDYDNGALLFFAPGQTLEVGILEEGTPAGKMLMFHPDLLDDTVLDGRMPRYEFFGYISQEALHVSEREMKLCYGCLKNIDEELNQNIDLHTRELIASAIMLLLNYSQRFYDRQFITRHEVNSNVLSEFERLLGKYYDAGSGKMPSVKYFADKLCLSPNYFGSLIKAETGQSPQDFIRRHIVETAKQKLRTSRTSIQTISDQLGFEYSQSFSSMFKRQTGMTPMQYRNQITN